MAMTLHYCRYHMIRGQVHRGMWWNAPARTPVSMILTVSPHYSGPAATFSVVIMEILAPTLCHS
jgi:hypothetical protein